MSSIVPIENVPPYVQSIASAGQQIFDTNWTADDDADVVVYARADGADPDDVTDLVDPADYTVTYVGVGEEVRVTFLVGRTLDDIVTIMRMTPVERLNLYTNTNFVPSMLNGDFGKQTMMIQEREYADNNLMPKYNNNATVVDVVDTILPILGAGQAWRKNDGNTAIEVVDLPDGGVAPDDASYITFTDESATLTGSVRIQNLADELTSGMGIPAGTTAQRVLPSGANIGLRYNTDLNQIEYYDGSGWVQLEDSTDLATILALFASHVAGEGASLIGLENQGTVTNKTVQDLSEQTFVTVNDETDTLVNAQQLSALALLLAGGTMAGNINMNNNSITNLPAPVAGGDAVNKTYADGFLPLAGGTMLGAIVLAGDAAAALQPVSLQQLQAAILNEHPACLVSTTANLAGYVYANGASGVGATLTAGGFGAFSSDGVSPSLNDRIFIPFQTAQAENGIYTLTVVGDGGTAAVLTRATDFDTASEINAGDVVTVVSGTLYATTQWMMTQTAAITVGTTDITWQQQSNTAALLKANNLSDLNSDVTARQNLGVEIGVDVQAYDAGLQSISGLATIANSMLYTTALDTYALIAPANSSVMVSSAGGVPSWSTSLPAGLTIPGYALSGANADITSMTGLTGALRAPTFILDSSGNEILGFTSVASAVNYLAVSNNSTGNQPIITAAGDDATISITLQPKGDAAVQVLGTASRGGTFNLYENTGNGTSYMQLKAPEALAASTTIYVGQEAAATVYLTYDTQPLAAWTDFSGSVGFTGFSVNPTVAVARYKKIGKTCFVNLVINNDGTSNATGFTVTGLPFTSASVEQWVPIAFAINNSAAVTANATISSASTVLTGAILNNGSGWTAANVKTMRSNFFYETA